MTINISLADVGQNLHPQITVLGVGGSGSNAVNNMMNSNLEGVDFLIANTDAQALQNSNCNKKIQLGIKSTKGLGAGMRPDVGKIAAEEALNEIGEKLDGSHMLFIAAGMGGGTGTGATPVIAKLAREKGILTVGVVTKPFHFEGTQRMKLAEKGLEELQQFVDTLLVIPNQNLFRIANEMTTFADAFKMADDVLYAGVRGVTDLMVQPGLINLDFSDVKTVMSEMGKAMMGTGEASGEGRSIAAAEAAIANPLIDDVSLKGAKGLIINITGGNDITLYEVDEAANRIKQEVDENANIIYGTTCDDRLEGVVRVSIVATGIDANISMATKPLESMQNLSIDNSVYQTNDTNQSVEKIDENDENINSSISSQEEQINDNIELEEDDNEMNLLSSEETTIEDKHTQNEDEIISSSVQESNDLREDESSNTDENPVHNEILESSNKDSLANTELVNQPEGDSHLESNEKTSVRRLSLFDNLEADKSQPELQNSGLNHDIKSAPILNEEENITSKAEESIESDPQENSLDPDSQDENISDEEEFNQENDEELLDIPTFLRNRKV